jgi:hypothetical protein
MKASMRATTEKPERPPSGLLKVVRDVLIE